MKVVLLRFLVLLIPLLSLTAVASYYIYQEDAKQLKQRIHEREQSRHISSLHITRLHFSPILEDLHYLSEKSREEFVLSGHSFDESLTILTATFKRLANTRRYYDQVRLLDENGQEVIRINSVDGNTTVVPDKQLQDKSHRPYVVEALNIPPGQIYTSPFDLNMENGRIELPYKPMIRFFSHLKVNGKSYLVGLNYLGMDYLNELTQQYGWQNSQNWLVNNEGQWLLGPDRTSAWQFMLPSNNPAVTDFNQDFPTLWQQIQLNAKGQFISGDYLYTFTRFFSGKGFSGDKPFTLPFDGADLPWTIISRVNLTNAIDELAFSQQRIIKFVAFVILILALLSGCIVLTWHLSQMLNAQRRLTRNVEDAALKYQTVLTSAPDGLITLDMQMNVLTMNPAAHKILMLPNKSLSGKNLLRLVAGGKTRKQLKELIDDLHERKVGQSNEASPVVKATIQLRGIRPRYIEIIATETTYSESDEILLNIRDVTEWSLREDKLKSLSRALEQSNDAIIITDYKGIVEYVNPSFEKQNGVRSKEIVGTQSTRLLRQSLPSNHELIKVQEQLKLGMTVQRVIAHEQDDKDVLYEEKTISPIRNSRGKISHYISTGKDITERVLFETRLQKLAHFDLLTELPNRTLLQQKIDSTINGHHHPEQCVALLSVDLDHFKQVNDSFGYDFGDKLIQTVAGRIQHILRETDFLARLGGDEFAILICGEMTVEHISRLAERIITHISDPMCVDNKEVFLTASVGISLYPMDAGTADELSKHADIALYRAKEEGQNRYCYYTPEMGRESLLKLQLESELRKSIGSDQYELYYQPKVNATNHTLCGVEALLRWHNEAGEIQPPVEVIPILERSGLIIQVGQQLIRTACQQLRAWQENGVYINFALNISARQLLNSNLVETVQQAIEDFQCDPNFLELEITESVIMSDVTTALDRLVKLEALGVKIAVDDFGTGYSSLAYLSRFPIHILKVDREFIKELPWNQDNVTITRSIVELAHNLNMRVVAEGVETDPQQRFLASIGVEEFQGYYFGHPVPVNTFENKYITQDNESVL